MKLNLAAILLIVAAASCKKSSADNQQTVTPPTVAVKDSAQYGTPFANVPDTRDVIIYQVNTRAFSASGNFQGVIARLDSIKALGINVVYLMPVTPVGVLKSANSPYCVKDYMAVGSEFGTMADLRALVDGAHARNMSVVLDWVANHTSWDNAWITDHPDWYVHNSAGAIVYPSTYTDVAQLDFSNSAMRLQMIKDMKNWVFMANIDGFRCDYADGPTDAFWVQAVDTLRNIKTHKLLLLAESSATMKYADGFDYIFGFNFYGNLKSIYSSNTSVQTIDNLNNTDYAGILNSQQQVVRYTTNHDVNSSDGTPLTLFGGTSGSLAAFTIAAYMKSVPFVYNGQEVGDIVPITFPFTGTAVKINWSQNIAITAQYKKILSFRNSSAAIRRGTLTSYDNADVCAFTKTSGTENALVIVNVRNASITYTLPTALANTTWLDKINGGNVSLTTQITLKPYQYLVLDNQ